jgi:hypothetical protein
MVMAIMEEAAAVVVVDPITIAAREVEETMRIQRCSLMRLPIKIT